MKRILSMIAGVSLLFSGICGLHFHTAIQAVDASRAALEPLVTAVEAAQTAKMNAKAALDEANAALAAAENGTDAVVLEMAEEEVKTCERNLRNATKKAENKQMELDAAMAVSVSEGNAADGWFVRGCSLLRFVLLSAGIVVMVLTLRNAERDGRGAALTCGAFGGVFVAAGILLCIYPPGIANTGGFWSLVVGATLAYRGLLILAGLVLFGAAIYADPKRSADKTVCIIFLAPTLAAFLLTVIIPFFLGVFYSLTDWNGNVVTKFVGFENFKGIFSEASFLHSFYVTIEFTLLSMALVNVVAFLLALLVTGRLKGKNFYRAGFFVPNLIGGIVLGYIWQFIFNHVTPIIGTALGWETLSQSMLASPDTALAAIITVNVWQYAGYIMMIYVAAIQGVPDSVLEAAQVDGASKWTRTVKIVLPMISNAVTICIFLTLVTSFKQFDLNYSLTVGGPATLFMGKAISSTEFLALNIYNTAFSKHAMAVGQAKAVVFFLVLVVVSLLQVWAGKRREVEL